MLKKKIWTSTGASTQTRCRSAMPKPIMYITCDGEKDWLCVIHDNEFHKFEMSMIAAARLNHCLAEYMAKNIRGAYVPRHDLGPIQINDNAFDYGLAANPEE